MTFLCASGTFHLLWAACTLLQLYLNSLVIDDSDAPLRGSTVRYGNVGIHLVKVAGGLLCNIATNCLQLEPAGRPQATYTENVMLLCGK